MEAISLLLMCLAVLVVGIAVNLPVRAADGEGAYTHRNGYAESYWKDKQTGFAYTALDGTGDISDVSVADDTDLVALYDSSSASNGVRQNVPVSMRFSDAGATATIYMCFYYYNGTTYRFLGYDQPMAGGVAVDIAAGSVRDQTQTREYTAPTYVFDSYGATHVRLICTSISAGTADAGVGSY